MTPNNASSPRTTSWTTTALPLRYGLVTPALGAHVTASRLLRKANVASLVAEHEAEAAERLAITREKVLTEIQNAIELARQQGDVPAMISGWKLVCQMCGYLAPERKKVELSVDAEALQAKFAAMDDSELLAIAGERSEFLS